MSHAGNDELKENLFEHYYSLLVEQGWPKNDWRTARQAQIRMEEDWAERD